MTVVGLHPEELFDKLLDGELLPPERERLRAHLDVCELCRFEYAARLDFQAEALSLSVSSPPPALPLRPLLASGSEPETPAVPVPPRRSRFLRWGLAAAALITASAAVASGVVGKAPWHAVASLFGQTATLNERHAALPPKKTAGAVSVPVVQTPVVEAPVLEAPVVEAPSMRRAARLHAHETAKHTSNGPRPLLAVAPVATGAPSARDGAAKELAAKEPSSAAKLFGEANQARRSGDIGRSSGLYHLLQDQYPGSPEAELSRVTLALLLLDSGDAQAALVGFERYLAGSSRALEAEALVGRARALGRLGRRDLEANAWREVQRKYSRSIYGRQASDRLLSLGQP